MSAIHRDKSTANEHVAPWKHGHVPVIGLIGAIGGGKSRVASMLEDRGALVLDADSMAHRLLEFSSIRDRVVDRFGPGILKVDDKAAHTTEPGIDRGALGKIVFADSAALKDLESLLHPAIRNEFERIIEETNRAESAPAVVLDAAVLLEAGWHDLCDYLVCVDAPREIRLGRVRTQRGWSSETLAAREHAQWPLDQKKRCSNLVIMNDSGPEHLEREVDRFWPWLSRHDSMEMADSEVGQEA